MAKAIIEMVHLMYQNNTAANFYKGLDEGIKIEIERRNLTSAWSRPRKKGGSG